MVGSGWVGAVNSGDGGLGAAAALMAMAAREKALDAEARAIIAAGIPQGATPEQMRQYADAVQRLHPKKEDETGWRIMYGLGLLSTVAGAIWLAPLMAFDKPHFLWRVIGALTGALAFIVCALVFGLVGFVLFGSSKEETP